MRVQLSAGICNSIRGTVGPWARHGKSPTYLYLSIYLQEPACIYNFDAAEGPIEKNTSGNRTMPVLQWAIYLKPFRSRDAYISRDLDRERQLLNIRRGFCRRRTSYVTYPSRSSAGYDHLVSL